MKENQTEKPIPHPRSTDQGGDNRVLLEKQSSRIHTLINVLNPENMQLAWQRVRANKGAPGIDCMSVGDFPAFMEKHGETILQKLRDGRYRPSPVKQCKIPKVKGKKDGDYRVLGIPTVLDRVIQQAIAQVLSPFYEKQFSDHSYGYRPHRSAQDAVEKMHQYANDRTKKCHVVDCDLKAFFDTVDHQKLMVKLRENIADRELLELMVKYLKAGAITAEGQFINTPQGVPQGGPLSPLLANILLDELDGELESRGHDFVRYADDFVIMCNSSRAGARILESVSEYLRTKLRLIVNTTKSKVVLLKDARFLGFKIYRRKIRWTEEAKERFKSEVKRLTSRTRGVAVGVVYYDLRNYLRGALNYYLVGVTFREVRELDHWIRRRMRMYYWKQWGRPRARRLNLIKLGASRDKVKLASRSRKGAWRICNIEIVRNAMTNVWLESQGLHSLETQWVNARHPQESTKTT
ncbi:MAG: group II intron reverse transcriptase/maturase [Akkermansiaceae bacterium]